MKIENIGLYIIAALAALFLITEIASCARGTRTVDAPKFHQGVPGDNFDPEPFTPGKRID